MSRHSNVACSLPPPPHPPPNCLFFLSQFTVVPGSIVVQLSCTSQAACAAFGTICTAAPAPDSFTVCSGVFATVFLCVCVVSPFSFTLTPRTIPGTCDFTTQFIDLSTGVCNLISTAPCGSDFTAVAATRTSDRVCAPTNGQGLSSETNANGGESGSSSSSASMMPFIGAAVGGILLVVLIAAVVLRRRKSASSGKPNEGLFNPLYNVALTGKGS
jgi:hypothetical protein